MDIAVAFLVGFHIARIARRKNRNPVGYVLAFVFAFIGLGCGGGVASLALSDFDFENGGDNDFILAFLPGLLIGYVLAVGFGYALVCAVPPLPKRRREYEDYDDDYDDHDAGGRPIRGPRDRGRYDDAPRRTRDDEDYDDYDRPPRRRDDY